jgi:adenylate cyclase
VALDITQLRDDPKFQDVRAESEAFMKTLQAQIIVPLLQSDQIIALIALGERRNLKAYAQTDLEFLDRLAAEASKSLINANLFSEVDKQRRALQDLTTTLEERVKSRTLELEHANESLRLLDRYKTNFFANISHEFRTPLTLILGPLEQMRAGELKGNLHEAYDIMLRNGRRLLRLINQLLDLARLGGGTHVFASTTG